MTQDRDSTAHAGDSSPIKGRHVFVVKLRSGATAIIAPRDDDSYDFDTEAVWIQTGDGDDIVGYRQLPLLGDEIIREIESYLSQEEALINDPIRDHHLMRLAVVNRRRSLREKIAAYKADWPNDDTLSGAKRLTEWTSEEV